jgi:hypothetical protein
MEDKKFFVKDFIKYCSPCFGCSHLMTFRMGYRDEGLEDIDIERDITSTTTMAMVTEEYLEVDLAIRYRSNLKLWIRFRDQKLSSSDPKSFKELMDKRWLFLYSKCHSCQSRIISKKLDFHRFNGVVAPVTLRHEEFYISRGNKRYSLTSNFLTGKSMGTLRVYTAPGIGPPDLKWEMKLLPKYKILTQQRLIEKLNTYAVFS